MCPMLMRLMLKLKLQYTATDRKGLLIGKDPDSKKRVKPKKGVAENEMVECVTDSMGRNLSKLLERVKDREA